MDINKQHTDEELLALYRNTTDNQWLGVLLQRYTVLLIGVGVKYLKDKEKAADAVQQVFLKALTAIPDSDIENFKGWLYIMMRNHCLQLLRQKKYMQGDEVLEEQQAPPAPDVQSMYELDNNIDRMKEALEQLEEGQQVCITLFYLEKKTYQQIMEQRGYTFMQVKSYIQNGKRRLKTIIAAKKNGTK